MEFGPAGIASLWRCRLFSPDTGRDSIHLLENIRSEQAQNERLDTQFDIQNQGSFGKKNPTETGGEIN